MSHRRLLSTLSSEVFDFDEPPASVTLAEGVRTRLSRLHRTLERTREESVRQSETARHERWAHPPSLRRRRLLRPADGRPPTYEGSSRAYPAESSEDEELRPRQSKRRRLDTHKHVPETKAHRYGHYGQVQPGKLRLEILGCDGEVHDSQGPVYFGPTNILKHDKSVYCTKTKECEIVLGHHDNTPFCLETLHIIGPGSGFTAPVKQGTVCIAMNVDDLIPFHVQAMEREVDQLPNTPPDPNADNERLSLLESLNDPAISRAVHRRETYRWHIQPHQQAYPFGDGRRDGLVWTGDFGWPPLQPTVWGRRASNSHDVTTPREEITLESGMRVIMDPSGAETEWPEEATSAAVLRDRQDRERQLREEGLDSDEEQIPAWDPRFQGNPRVRRAPDLPRLFPPLGARTPRTMRTTSSGEVTRVHFEIESKRNNVAIKFIPPVSGTCMLLQLQAPWGRNNIDIQTVLALGYAGPRFLPALNPA